MGFNSFYKKLFGPVTSVPAALQAPYFEALDGLRGIAVLMVVFAHLGGNVLLNPLGLSINSRTGVDLFFVLSGFLITTILLKEQLTKGKASLSQFYIRRVLRIIPAAYGFLAVLWLLNIFFHLNIRLFDFAASAVFIKNLPMPNEPFTAHFWSLAVEMQFYLIFPALLLSNVNRYTAIALLIVIGATAISFCGEHFVSINHYPATNWLNRLSRYTFWKGPVIILIGSLLSIFMFKGIIPVTSASGRNILVAVLLLLALVITTRAFSYYTRYVSEFVGAVLFAMVILFSLKGRGFLSSRLLVRTGLISYSMYIWQELFIGTNTWQPWLRFMDGYPMVIIIMVKLGLLLLISTLSYYFIERLFLRLKSKFK